MAKIGTINEKIKRDFDLKKDVILANINWQFLVEECLESQRTKVSSLLKYPKVIKDIAIIIDKSIMFNTIKEALEAMNHKFLKNISLFDVYTENMLKDKKCYGIRLTLYDKNKTLSDNDIKKNDRRDNQSFRK